MPEGEKKFIIQCHHCSSNLSVSDTAVGKTGICPECQKVVLICRAQKTKDWEIEKPPTESDNRAEDYIYFQCHVCAKKLKASMSLRGKECTCPQCKHPLIITGAPFSSSPSSPGKHQEQQQSPNGGNRSFIKQNSGRPPVTISKDKDEDLKLYRIITPPTLAFCSASLVLYYYRIQGIPAIQVLDVFGVTLLGSFLLFYLITSSILKAISVKRDIKFLQTDLITHNPKSNIANRFSLYNLFWDLGADATSYQILCDLQIADFEHRVFVPHNCRKVADLVKKVGGYQLFIMTLQNMYDTSPIQEELRNCPSADSRFISLSDKILSVNSQLVLDLMSFDSINFKRYKEKGIISLQYAVAGMFGANSLVTAYNVGKNIPQIKSAAMQYYRINRQTGSESEAIFRTIEDVGVSLTANVAGTLVGASAGAAVAKAGISEGFFDMFDFGGDGFNRVEVTLIIMAGMLVGSILTGELFKKIGNWWRHRHLRRYIRGYNDSCIYLYNTVFENPILQQKFNDNINFFVNYWIDKRLNLEDLIKSRIKPSSTIQTLVKLALEENKVILSHHVKQKKQLLKCLNENVKQGKTEIAGQLLLAHRKLVFRDMPEIQPMLNLIKDRFTAVCNEYNNLKQKGLITAEA